MDDHGRIGPLEWAVAGRPLPGEDKSGDGWLVTESGACALLAVIDGLGHGPPAAVAADRATAVLHENRGQPLDLLLIHCHEELTATRGAAITLALVDPQIPSVRWLGIGNVTGSLVRMTPAGPSVLRSAMLHGGVVGHKMPRSLRQVTATLEPGDVVLMGTDGLGSGFDERPDLRRPANELAVNILARCATASDDALVLVARYRGRTG